MNTKKTLIAFIILIVLVVVYLWDSSRKAEMEEAETAEKKLTGMDIENIKQINLKRKDETIKLVKDTEKEEWLIELPDEGKVSTDESTVSSLTSSLENVEKLETLEGADDLEKFGLKKPNIEIQISTDEKEQLFKLGKKNPTDDGVYVMVDDDKKIYVADISLHDSSNKTVYDFRDKKLLKFDRKEISEIALNVNRGSLLFDREEDSKWQLTADKTYRADTEKISLLLTTISNAEIKEFLKGDTGLKKIGLKSPAKRISFKKEDGSELSLGFGEIKPAEKEKTEESETAPKAKDLIYVQSSAHKYPVLVEKSIVEQLDGNLNAWRSKNILDVDFDAINDTRIKGPEKSVAFKRIGSSEYQIYRPEEIKTSHWECNTLNTRLSNLKNVKFLEASDSILKKAGFNNPYAAITITTGKNELNPDIEKEEKYKIIIGNSTKVDEDDVRYVKISGKDEEIYLVKTESLDEVLKTPFELRDKQLVDITAGAVESIKIRTEVDGKMTDILIERDGEEWSVEEPESLSEKDADDIVWDVIGLRMTGTAVKPAGLKEYGLETPFAVITVNMKEEEPITIKIGNLIPGDAEDQCYLMLGSDETIYTVNTTLRSAIDGLKQLSED